MDRIPVEEPEGAEFFQGDILDPEDAWRAVRGIDARAHGIQIVCFQLVQLRPRPTERTIGDSCAFIVVWEDLAHACRLALEIESVPDHFQVFNLHSFGLQGRYLIEKAERILGYRPLEQVEDYFKRRT